jgi:hypothetical protein
MKEEGHCVWRSSFVAKIKINDKNKKTKRIKNKNKKKKIINKKKKKNKISTFSKRLQPIN